MNSFLLGVLLLASLASADDAEDRTPTPKQAVLKAIAFAEGKGFFRSSLEVAVSEKDGKVTVLFCRPTSDVMESEGRKPTKRLWLTTFQGEQVKTEPLDEKAAEPKFDSEYSRERDRVAVRAVATALSHLWKGQEFEAKEFAVDVSAGEDRDLIVISHIPYTPDAHTMIYVYPDGHVESTLP
jgi:hypothetical protein